MYTTHLTRLTESLQHSLKKLHSRWPVQQVKPHQKAADRQSIAKQLNARSADRVSNVHTHNDTVLTICCIGDSSVSYTFRT